MPFALSKRNALVIAIGLWTATSRNHAAETSAAPGVAAIPVPAVLLLPPHDNTSLDAQIRASQQRLERTAHRGEELERLGWLFVAKARASSDPGFYTLAGLAADALERDYPLAFEAWLLRGHVLQTRHRFAEAEELGRRLVAARGTAADYALLGDALYDEGRVAEAADAYQHMVDLKPSLDSYSRAANIRWVKGDLPGAIELQTLAVRSSGAGDPGALAWSLVRLGQFVWQNGDAPAANALADRALKIAPEFQPALLLQGRLLLAAGHAAEALVPLARATAILPLPETRWVYAEALRSAGQEPAAVELEALLVREGLREDPRTVALFLATHQRDPVTALRLASDELKTRADVVTHSAHALTLAGVGQVAEALDQSRAALREGTVDPRLLLHAGRIHALAHEPDASELLMRAEHLRELLLPSERRLLADSLLLLPPGSIPRGNPPETTPPKTS